ncbi:MAG: tRNA-dihydrouridine synthase [Patescibacteria group bacterium]|nr:tRNA-dihydrouridine synthase [Patescibacteria group bacterium]
MYKKLKRKWNKILFVLSEFVTNIFNLGKSSLDYELNSEHFKDIFDRSKKKVDSDKIVFGFWKELSENAKKENRPLYVLAPMADVTDVAFRHMLNKYGKPDVTWTEFVSANGLMSEGREHLKRDLEYKEEERPIVAQLFTSEEKNMEGAARLCTELGFDGIDINMGCPDKTIEKQGAGSKMITTPEIAKEVIMAAQRGAIRKNKITGEIEAVPVSVKTRIGWNKVEWQSWLPQILECNIPVLTVHLRTRKELSMVPAHYEYIDDIYNMVKSISPKTLLIINGDIKSLGHADELYSKYAFDGAMIGRAVFGKPWLFDKEKTLKENDYSLEEKLRIMIEHTKLFEEKLGDIKSFSIMKKHYKAYVNGFDGAKELRNKLFESKNAKEAENTVNNFLKSVDL